MHMPAKPRRRLASLFPRFIAVAAGWFHKCRSRASVRQIPDALLKDVLQDRVELSREIKRRQSTGLTRDPKIF